eukprot:Gb_13624 [translate_table: standard]
MANTFATGFPVRYAIYINGCSRDFKSVHVKGIVASSKLLPRNLKLCCYPKKPNHSLRTGQHRLLVWATAKAEEVEVDEGAESKEAAKLLRRVADWKKAETYKESGEIYEGKVDGSNSGGLLVRFHSLQGFLPYSQMSSSRVLKDGSKMMSEAAKYLIGTTISLKIIQVNEQEKKLIFSEKQAIWANFVDQIKDGDIFEGRVNSVADFGAFVDLRFPDGGYHVGGLVHISEISWDLVRNVRDVLKEGEEVQVKVVEIDKEKLRLALSIKQLQADPLFETLDTVLPQEEFVYTDKSSADGEVTSEPLPGLEQICEELLQETGITEVKIGRQALEKRVVSQDLELWLSNTAVEDGRFTLLARAGRQVQEVYLQTSLDREGIKQAVQRVTGRVP